jgi:hypothetical protein
LSVSVALSSAIPTTKYDVTVQATVSDAEVANGSQESEQSHSIVETDTSITGAADAIDTTVTVVVDYHDDGTGVLVASVGSGVETAATQAAVIAASQRSSAANAGVVEKEEVGAEGEKLDQEDEQGQQQEQEPEEDLRVCVDKVVASTGRQKKYVLAAALANQHVRRVGR